MSNPGNLSPLCAHYKCHANTSHSTRFKVVLLHILFDTGKLQLRRKKVESILVHLLLTFWAFIKNHRNERLNEVMVLRMLWKSRLALSDLRSVVSYLLHSPFDAEFLEKDKALAQSVSGNPNQCFKLLQKHQNIFLQFCFIHGLQIFKQDFI